MTIRYVEFWAGAYDEDLSYRELERACGNDPRTALRLVAELSTNWLSRGLAGEAARAAGRVLDALGPAVPAGLEEEYLLAVLLAPGTSDQKQLELAQRVALELDHFHYPMTVLLWAALFGPFETVEVVEEVLARNEGAGDAWTRAAVQLCRGYPGLSGGDARQESAALETALARFRMLGDQWGTFLVLTAMADVSDMPLELVSEALTLASELELAEDAALLLCRRADLYRRQGDLEAARNDYGSALLVAERVRLLETAAAARIGLARIARYSGDLPTARKYAEAALTGCPGDLPEAREEAQHELAAIESASIPGPQRPAAP